MPPANQMQKAFVRTIGDVITVSLAKVLAFVHTAAEEQNAHLAEVESTASTISAAIDVTDALVSTAVDKTSVLHVRNDQTEKSGVVLVSIVVFCQQRNASP